MVHLIEKPLVTDRAIVMARLARNIGRGRDAIYHGTRGLPSVMRSGKLLPADIVETAVFFSRSPEIAAYWATLMGTENDQFIGGVLVLDRASLVYNYRLEPSRYTEDWDDEREENIWGRSVSFRRHLLGVVREIDVEAILGPPRHRYVADSFFRWPKRKKQLFWKEQERDCQGLVGAGRAKVREIIIRERELARRRERSNGTRKRSTSKARQSHPARRAKARKV